MQRQDSRRTIVQFSLQLLVLISAKSSYALYGGRDANIWDYPHHAAIEENTRVGPNFTCSGAILSPHVVLTAASCVQKFYDPKDILVRVGSTRFQSGGTVYKVSNMYTHPDYSSGYYGYDVSVLQLRSPIRWNQDAHMVKLPRASYQTRYNSTVYASSWGSYEDGSLSLRLRHASFKVTRCPVESVGNARNTSSSSYYESQAICATNYPQKGTCQRDEGAPLIEKGRLVGLATRQGLGCNSTHFTSMFVRLSNTDIHSFIDQYL